MNVQVATWRRSDHVAHVDGPDRVAVLDLAHLRRPPMILEGSAAVIWQLLDGSRDVAALTEAVAQHFHVTAEEIGPSVAAFLDQLRDLELIEPA